MNKSLFTLPVSIYGDLQPYSETMSRARLRIFYKGGNRNGGFITDQFAEQLLATLPYTPVKGIYQDEDFTDHGLERSDGRIYGIVPADYNLTWEKHIDSDGIERTYACTDVLVYTALYEEAQLIPYKTESMELYRKTLKGSWQHLNGQKFYVYEHAHFLGFQILGDKVTPCFEGAGFYNPEVFNLLPNNEIDDSQDAGKGGQFMSVINFQVSNKEKFETLWSMLNNEFEGSGICKYTILEMNDTNAIVKNYETGAYELVVFTVSEENGMTIDSQVPTFMLGVSEAEYNSLVALKGMNNDTFEAIDAQFTALNNQISKKDTKIVEQETELSTLKMDNENIIAENQTLHTACDNSTVELNEAKATIEALTAERDTLAEFKKTIDDNQKTALIDSYATQLDEEVVSDFKNNLDKYSYEELDIRLVYAIKKSHPEMFSATQESSTPYVPKDDGETNPWAFLDKYERK